MFHVTDMPYANKKHKNFEINFFQIFPIYNTYTIHIKKFKKHFQSYACIYAHTRT